MNLACQDQLDTRLVEKDLFALKSFSRIVFSLILDDCNLLFWDCAHISDVPESEMIALVPLKVLSEVVHDVVAAWNVLDDYTVFFVKVLLLCSEVVLSFIFLPICIPRWWGRWWNHISTLSWVRAWVSDHRFLLSLSKITLIIKGFLRMTSVFRDVASFTKIGVLLRVRMLSLSRSIVFTVVIRFYLTGSNKVNSRYRKPGLSFPPFSDIGE